MRLRFVPRALLAVLLAVFVTGCASTAAYEKALDGWLGKSADSLVAEWGPPQATYTYEDGRKSLQYRERSIDSVPPVTGYNPYGVRDTTLLGGYTRELVCVTTFETDAGGVIRAWKWKGNACAIAPE